MHVKILQSTAHKFSVNLSSLQFRDWNEEFQSSRELPRGTVRYQLQWWSKICRERIIRDHAIVKVNNDFVEAATKGAM